MLAVSPEFVEDEAKRRELLACEPNLRAFAMSLCGNPDRAADLVQETFLRAIVNIGSFQPGTNMGAWLFTILRNHFRSEWRKRHREVEDTSGVLAGTGTPTAAIPMRVLTAGGEHDEIARLDYSIMQDCLERLPAEQREALTLVVLGEFSYEEAAEIAQCAIGTIKSRVNRARDALAAKMGGYGEGHRADQPELAGGSAAEDAAWASLQGALDEYDDDR